VRTNRCTLPFDALADAIIEITVTIWNKESHPKIASLL
jgi:hypothetical protein